MKNYLFLGIILLVIVLFVFWIFKSGKETPIEPPVQNSDKSELKRIPDDYEPPINEEKWY